MRPRRYGAAALAAALLAAATTITASAQDPPKPAPGSVTGKWTMTLDIENMGPATTALVLEQEGEKITGTYTGRYGTFPLEGKLAERKIAFTVYLKAEGQESTMYFEGEVAEDARSMAGKGVIEGLGNVTWSAKRVKGSEQFSTGFRG